MQKRLPHESKLEIHPLKDDILRKIDAGKTPYEIKDWLVKKQKELGESKEFLISVPGLYTYKKKREYSQKQKSIKTALKSSRHEKDLGHIERDIRKINGALSKHTLSKLDPKYARSYSDLISAKIRLITLKEKLIENYGEEEKDVSVVMAKLFNKIRERELKAEKNA